MYWCSTCKHLYTTGNEEDIHSTHSVSLLGNDGSKTLVCLDEVIQYGLESIQNTRTTMDEARKSLKDIDAMKKRFMENLKIRIEKIVDDLRVALDEQAMVLLSDVDKEVCDVTTRAKESVEASGLTLDTEKEFIRRAAEIMPDDEGNISSEQLTIMYLNYKTIQKMQENPISQIRPVKTVNIKFPNSMKTKTECANFAKRVIGEIVDTKRPSILDASRPSIDVRNVNDFGYYNENDN